MQDGFFYCYFCATQSGLPQIITPLLVMKLYLFLLLLLSLGTQAQMQVNGIVTNKKQQPLPFATISTDNNLTTITDVDGKFSIASNALVNSLSVTYIGYELKTIPVRGDKIFYTIILKQETASLKAVVVSNENPALNIIRKTIAAKRNTNPQNRWTTFKYKNYNKLIVTANPDSIRGYIDTTTTHRNTSRERIEIDSANYKFKELISKQHLFQTEKVSQFDFSNNKLKQTVLGIKMAGFKQPIYEIMGFNLQSLSIYDPKYELFETKYNSPISVDALHDYNYKILDTIKIKGRPTFMVYFKNKKKSRANGLEGALYIDTENYGIAQALMRIRGVLDISGRHEFEYLENEKIWFPQSTTFKIVKGKNDDDIKILGGTIQFEGDTEKDFKTRKKQATDFTYVLSQSNTFDLEYNVPVRIQRPAIAMELTEAAITREESFWKKYRKDSLDIRSQKSYVLLDSISIAKRIESRLKFGRKVIDGYLPLGIFDFDLRKLISYNNYEGFRFGIGGVTNDHLSKNFRIEGYSAYGTKDGVFKYNIGSGFRVGKLTNSWLNASYTDDVREIASTVYAVDKRVFKLYDPRPINISTFYHYVSYKANFQTRIIPKTEALLEFSRSYIEPKFDYLYNLNGQLYSDYVMTTAMLSIAWNPFSEYMQTPTGRMESEKRYPKFTLQYTQALPNVLQNDFLFGKIDFKTEVEKKYLNGQKSSALLQLGYAYGNVPLTHLYNTGPNNLTKETIFERITFAGRNSFETMYFNEFFSTEYAMLQLKHGFNRITLLSVLKPSLVLVTRMAWGDLQKPEQHVGPTYKTLNNGFFESGIELNQIYKGFGLSGFYRYGPNGLAKIQDNIAVKLSFRLDLGL
ncbi:hypothetical protein AP058_02558 [Flavobacterium sp. TAB 87]|nr:hypothetical protein AP058_02558 [Flavobacterium sp. TAB 87]